MQAILERQPFGRTHARERTAEIYDALVHELKAPCTCIQAYAELLLDPRSGVQDSTQRGHLHVIARMSAELHRLAVQVLDCQRGEEGGIALAPGRFPVNELVVEVVEAMAPVLVKKQVGVELRLAPRAIAYADRDRIREVLTNLLSNAARFTGEGGQVAVSAQYDGRSDRVVVEVSDTGCGMTRRQMRHLFERFSPVATQSGGSGVGLYLVKQILEAHGEKIHVRSTPEVGTTFRFTLAAAPETE